MIRARQVPSRALTDLPQQDRRQLAERLLLADEEDLLAAIGAALNRDLGAAPQDKKSLIEGARQWFTDNAADLKARVCGSVRIQAAVRDDDKLSNANLLLLIADTLISIKGGVPAMYVAAMIVMRGVRDLCHAHW